MGKDWDHDKGGRNNWIKWMTEIMVEAKRCIKPGGHLFVWALPRTSHWTATALEDAGFEVRDIVTHVFGSGFPKSLNVGKNINKIWNKKIENVSSEEKRVSTLNYINGLGTGLKPAAEHWILCRKPLSEKTVAENVLKWGTGGINIDGSRVETNDKLEASKLTDIRGADLQGNKNGQKNGKFDRLYIPNSEGRFPANFIHDGSDEVMEEFDKAGKTSQGHWSRTKTKGYGKYGGGESIYEGVGRKEDGGCAARFFYCSKASGKERNEGLDEFDDKIIIGSISNNNGNKEGIMNLGGASLKGERKQIKPVKNNHPTVKAVKLMTYLINMITPPNGIVLDPFMGSGSTGVAAVKAGFNFIGIEMEDEYMEIAKARINYARAI